jgi:hypothetical protein
MILLKVFKSLLQKTADPDKTEDYRSVHSSHFTCSLGFSLVEEQDRGSATSSLVLIAMLIDSNAKFSIQCLLNINLVAARVNPIF